MKYFIVNNILLCYNRYYNNKQNEKGNYVKIEISGNFRKVRRITIHDK
jgi:hypothetical protein